MQTKNIQILAAALVLLLAASCQKDGVRTLHLPPSLTSYNWPGWSPRTVCLDYIDRNAALIRADGE